MYLYLLCTGDTGGGGSPGGGFKADFLSLMNYHTFI